MQSSALPILHCSDRRVLPPGCDGIWPVYSHLQPLALPCHYVQEVLCAPCVQLLLHKLHERNYSNIIYIPLVLLQLQHHQSFLLRCASHAEALLLWHITDLVHFTCATVLVISTMLLTLISYICIGVTIHKIKSAKGRCKAFFTCASHLTAVTMFYGTGSFMYLRPSSEYSVEHDKIISVFYTLAIPMLNPMIYSLRNKEVKEALRRTVARLYYSPCVPQGFRSPSRTERTWELLKENRQVGRFPPDKEKGKGNNI